MSQTTLEVVDKRKTFLKSRWQQQEKEVGSTEGNKEDQQH